MARRKKHWTTFRQVDRALYRIVDDPEHPEESLGAPARVQSDETYIGRVTIDVDEDALSWLLIKANRNRNRQAIGGPIRIRIEDAP